MKIILTDGTELFPILVMGERRYVQRESRDTLTFVFPASAGMEALDALFTSANCESVTVVENIVVNEETGETSEASYIHKGYAIRAELSMKPVQIEPPTEEKEAVYENRIFVSMSQRTDLESQMAEANAALKALATGEG